MMTTKVFFVVLACFQLVRCAAVTVNIQQKPSSSSNDDAYDYTLLVDFSMLSESCANETIDVISKSYDLQRSGYSCWGLNETFSTCKFGFDVEEYQDGCNASSGEFYTNPNMGDESWFVCGSNVDGKQYQTDVIVTDYPFCAGISCNKSEIIMAYDAMILADAESGQLGQVYRSHCIFPSRSPPTSTSIAYNRFTYGSIIYSMLAMFSCTILFAL